MSPEELLEQAAAKAGAVEGVAGEDAGAAQAVEGVEAGAGAAPEDFPHGLAQRGIAAEEDEDAAERLREDALIPGGLLLHAGERGRSTGRDQVVEGAADHIGVPAREVE